MGLIEAKREIDSKDEILVVPYESLASISEGNIQFTLALPLFIHEFYPILAYTSTQFYMYMQVIM